MVYILRDDEENPNFSQGIVDLFQEIFHTVKVVKLTDQKIQYKELTKGLNIISLDPLIPAENNLEISRLFKGYTQIGYTERPGSKPLTEQIEKIPDGEYYIYDDDIATGGTISYVKSILPERIRIQGDIALTRKTQDIYDIADIRDFLFGSKYGGLVIEKNNIIKRYPYTLPWVDIENRLKIPKCKIEYFSERVKEYNRSVI